MRVLDGPGGVSSAHIDHPAGLVRSGNQAALEIHVPMARAEAPETPTILAFDLDPGAPADAIDWAQVVLCVQEVLDAVGLVGFAKTSGSKGPQVSVPLNSDATTHQHASSFALVVGQLLERQHPKHVLVEMAKAKRPGKVFVDWSQNNHSKTTIGVYSLRAQPRPTASTAITWDEVSSAVNSGDRASLVFEAADVVARLGEHGDLFAEVQSMQQELPAPQG
jgi:bifunctional non-homologous end joining protein LigD